MITACQIDATKINQELRKEEANRKRNQTLEWGEKKEDS